MSVSYIPSGMPFLKTLAHGLLEQTALAPEKLSDIHLLLPTRRAVRAMIDLFLDATDGRPLLLPRLRAVADIDDEELEILLVAASGASVHLPPAISAIERQNALTAMLKIRDPGLDYGRASALAQALTELMDRMDDEGLSLDSLDHLVSEKYAAHWQHTVDFLSILRTLWPEYLVARGVMAPSARRSALLRLLVRYWQDHPPAHPVMIAGVSGSLPAVAELMRVVSDLPYGQVVLSAFDPEGFEQNPEGISDPQHPFYETTQLLTRLDLRPADLSVWSSQGEDSRVRDLLANRRAVFWRRVMEPAEKCPEWSALGADEGAGQMDGVLAGLKILECRSMQEEAQAIALHARVVLSDPAAQLAIVTPNRSLARAIMSACAGHGIEVNDSGGHPLSTSLPATFLTLIAQLAFTGIRSVDLISFLTHPLFDSVHLDQAACQRIDRKLRGQAPPEEGATFLTTLEKRGLPPKDAEALGGILGRFKTLQIQLMDPALSTSDKIRAHLGVAEELCARADSLSQLWREDAGETMANVLRRALDPSVVLPAVSGADYGFFFEQVIAGQNVNIRGVGHPRLSLLGVYESRLSTATHVVVAGMNEGDWPPAPPVDPWMSRAMRAEFGLPPEEQRVGRMAADFLALVMTPDVLLTRAVRYGSGASVPSRWIARLDTVVTALGRDPKKLRDPVLPAWIEMWDHPEFPFIPERPRPCPPALARPVEISATQVETLIRNPYAFYARRILRLYPLDPYDMPVDARLRGIILHRVLERFGEETRAPNLPPDAAERLIRILNDVSMEKIPDPALRAAILPRLRRAMIRYLDQEKSWRGAGHVPQAREQTWGLDIDVAGVLHRLTARFDRIDRRSAGGTVVMDYKTGSVLPPVSKMKSGELPQIPLELYLAIHGRPVEAKQERSPTDVAAALWPIHPSGAKIKVIDEITAQELVGRVQDHLILLLTRYRDATLPYYPLPVPAIVPEFDDYRHLARVDEWQGREGSGAA